MPTPRALSLGLCLLSQALFWPPAAPAWSALFKCREPGGGVSYQQTACDGLAEVAEGERLVVEIRGPDGHAGGESGEDHSVEGQAARMRAEREALTRARLQARREAEAQDRARRAASKPVVNPHLDPVKCAKHRGEAAEWKQKVMKGYRTRAEKDRNDSKLAYHQALMDRHCD